MMNVSWNSRIEIGIKLGNYFFWEKLMQRTTPLELIYSSGLIPGWTNKQLRYFSLRHPVITILMMSRAARCATNLQKTKAFSPQDIFSNCPQLKAQRQGIVCNYRQFIAKKEKNQSLEEQKAWICRQQNFPCRNSRLLRTAPVTRIAPVLPENCTENDSFSLSFLP